MAVPLVEQLRFTRAEFVRALAGISEDDGVTRLAPMNSIGWTVAHMAWHEQRNWLTRAQGRTPAPELNELARNGGPPTTPSLSAMLDVWRLVSTESDEWLDDLSRRDLATSLVIRDKPVASPGSALLRLIYHYWFHTGEVIAIRQLLGHSDVPEFVGDLERLAPFRSD